MSREELVVSIYKAVQEKSTPKRP